jgi:hypothetical protein
LDRVWVGFGSSFCDNLSVWFCFVLTEPKNHFKKIFQILPKNFLNFITKKKKKKKNIKIQYKNTLNQIIVKILQNLVFKNNNVIFCHFDISYFEIFNRLILGSVWFGFNQKTQFV